MDIRDRIVVVTGGASGIGRALCFAAHRAGARKLIVCDLDREGAERVAASVGGAARRCDVADEADLRALIERTEAEHGPIGLFCGNAGIAEFDPDWESAASAANAAWARSWAINVMAHVYAARALLPRYIARGGGAFLITASAAGLLSQIGGAAYATTKHAAIGFAESLAITHRAHGVLVSVLCPQAVTTPMLDAIGEGAQNVDGVLTPEAVAEAAIEGLGAERFLILPHPQVATYMARKSADYDRWLKGMAKLRDQLAGRSGRTRQGGP